MKTVIILFSLISSSCFAQLADKTLEGQLNTFIDTIQSNIDSRQTIYIGSKGKYFQGIATHPDAALPADGSTVTPTKTVKPTDQAENWTDFGVTFSSKIPCAVSITYYNGPQGKGYVVHYKLLVGSEKWIRSVNVGPETRRTHDWQITKDGL